MTKEDGQYGTTQLTSKRIKIQILWAWGLLILGMTVGLASDSAGWRMFGATIVVVSIVVWVAAKASKWWEHD